MSEEKKLTDEEIVKALKCIEGQYISYIENDDDKCKLLFVDDILDLIHRLQEDVERLTEELDLANETIDRNNKRYERVSIERQKALDRVDYLEDAVLDKIRRNEELITAIKQAKQQAVKDTAREILDEVSKHFGGRWLVELYKKYGLDWSVEVDYEN